MKLAPLVVIGMAGVAHADPGAVVFTRGGAVFEQAADGSGQAVKVAELPDDATEVRWVEATRDGKLVVLDFGTRVSWVVAPDPAKPAEMRGGPCLSRARPSPKGECVVCEGTDGPILASATSAATKPLPGPLGEATFVGPGGYQLAGITDQGVIGFDRRKPTDQHVLAKPGLSGHLLISPDGTRGVAVFGEKDAARVRAFMLDGEGVSRQLGGPGVPTLWSWDSTWVLFQEGDIANAPKGDGEGGEGMLETSDPYVLGAAPAAHKKPAPPPPKKKPEPAAAKPTTRVCVARATGGEVKCWDDFTGMSFSPDSSLVLLKKGSALYVGKIAGVHPDPPTKIVDSAEGAATWVPQLIAAPFQPGPAGVGSL